MSELLSLSDVCERFFWHIRKNYRNQAEAAEHYGVSVAFISAATRGTKKPNDAMLADIGLMKISGYVER